MTEYVPVPTRPVYRRWLGSPTLFAIVYTSVASAIYFALGVVGENALGLTPVVFLLAAGFFVITTMTYVEGASLHQERAGSTVFARYAFNELVSFVAAWAILLDFLILVAVAAYMTSDYVGVFWNGFEHGSAETVLVLGVVAYVAVRNVLGFSTRRARRILALVVADLAVQLVVIVLGLFLVLDVSQLTSQVDLGTTPRWGDLLFALTLGTVAFTSLESASGLAGEVAVGRRGLKRMVTSVALTVLVIYVGMSVVALSAMPVVDGRTELATTYLERPVLGIVHAYEPAWLSDVLRYVVGVLASVTLVAAANSGMLGLSRLAYSLGTNRQIPSAVGRLHPTRATPFVVIAIAAALAGALTLTKDIEFLVGIYAFGALLAFTLAHLSIVVLRVREPDRPTPYRVPFNVRVRGVDVPVPAVVGAVVSLLAFVSVLVLHEGARYVGLGWMTAGLLLYLVYRVSEEKPVLRRVRVPQEALQMPRERREAEYGSILVPLMGGPLDDDIVQTAGRLASEEQSDLTLDGEGATIEALWVFEVPMALPIDARLPDAQLERARAALRRAKAGGEEYAGVAVATATVRARRAGQAIVEEARRRGVEAIVLAAEEPTRVRGGALLGGRGGPRDQFVGDVTRYVVTKAPCRVILTAPPARDGG
ncbi:MAG TPA: amino acid permease [Solirubrobacteraceae bacterium]|nr:amino acid permease [Solirubrobacteraceae bacterium]